MDDLKELGIITFELDVTKQETIDRALQLVSDLCEGKLDVLYNNAGTEISNSLEDLPMENIQCMFDVNYLARFEWLKRSCPY